MKVAIISRGIPRKSDPVNGVFEFDQAKALAKQGLNVAFIVIDFRNLSYKRPFGLLKYIKDDVHVFELSLPIGVYRRALPFLQMLLLIPFRSMLKSFGKPDIIHAHFYSIAAIASIIKRKYCIPFIITEHSSKLNKNISLISKIDKRLTHKAYYHCDTLISVSEALRVNLINNFGHDSLVIPNIVDNNSFHLREAPASTNPFVFVSVGNLVPIKGFDTLIEAFAKIKENTKLYIIGTGPEKENLRKTIKEMHLGEYIYLLGQIERNEINKIFQKCHAFVLPSKSETFGVCYIEAMYAGLPVIATRCGGPESFVDSSNGLLVPVNDATALAQAMTDIRQNYAYYNPQRISENCLNKFSPSIISKHIIEAYRSKTF